MTRIEHEEDEKKGRFVIYEKDIFAGEMSYTWAGDDKFIIDHTAIEESFSAKGLGKKLVMKAIDFARNKNVKILPLCPFAKKVFDADSSLSDVQF